MLVAGESLGETVVAMVSAGAIESGKRNEEDSRYGADEELEYSTVDDFVMDEFDPANGVHNVIVSVVTVAFITPPPPPLSPEEVVGLAALALAQLKSFTFVESAIRISLTRS